MTLIQADRIYFSKSQVANAEIGYVDRSTDCGRNIIPVARLEQLQIGEDDPFKNVKEYAVMVKLIDGTKCDRSGFSSRESAETWLRENLL